VALVAPPTALAFASNIRAGNQAIKKIQLLKKRARSIHTPVFDAGSARHIEVIVKTKKWEK
jgi:hypothetical protein